MSGSSASASAAVALPKDTVDFWASEVLRIEGDISVLNLRLAEFKTDLNFARQRHRQKVRAQRVAALAVLTATEGEELLAASQPSQPKQTKLEKESEEVPELPPQYTDAPKRRKASPPRSNDSMKAQRASAPPRWCPACLREANTGAKAQGVAHIYISPCTKETPRKGKGRGKALRAAAQHVVPGQAMAAGSEVADAPRDLVE